MLAVDRRGRALPGVALSNAVLHCAFISFAALLLRIYSLGYRSIEQDEAGRIGVAQLPLGDVFAATIRTTTSPPLSDYLLDLWGHAVGFDEVHIRLWAAIWGTLAVAAAYLVGREVIPRFAWLGAAIVAVSPLHVFYSRDVGGPYYIWEAVAWLSMWAYLKYLRTTDKVWAGLYILLASIGLWLHFFMVLLVGAMLVHWLVKNWQEGWHHALAQRFSLLHLVLLPSIVGVAAIGTSQKLGTGLRIHAIDMLAALRSFAAFTVQILLSWIWGAPSAAAASAPLLAITSNRTVELLETGAELACVLVAAIWLRRVAHVRLLVFLAGAPVIVGLAVMIARGAVFYERHYLPFSLPAYLVLVIAVSSVPGRLRGPCLGLVLVACTAAIVLDLRAAEAPLGTRDWRGAAGFVGQHLSAQDRVVFPLADEQAMFDYYLPSKQASFLGLPTTFNLRDGYHFAGYRAMPGELEPFVKDLDAQGVGRVWVVSARKPEGTWDELVSTLQKHAYQQTGKQLFPGDSPIEVLTMERSAG